MSWLNFGKNLARILLACAIIVGIGAALITFAPESEQSGLPVNSARANIMWMTPSSPTNTQQFTAALRDLGHEAPRAYTLNDNNVYFSTRLTHKSPGRLIHEYQQAFVNSGLNSRMWLKSSDFLNGQPYSKANAREHDERAEAAMAGEVLPATVSANYFAMTGMLVKTPSESDDEDKLIETSVKTVEASQARLLNAYQQCNGDPAALQRARITVAQKPAEKGSATQKIDEALAGQTSCDKGGPQYCSDLRARLSQGRSELDALVAAIDAQPELKKCSAIKRYNAGTAELISNEMTTRIHAFRSLEATRDPKSGQTMVTASWSDEEFDMNSLLVDEYPVARKDADAVPLCGSCKRTWSFDGTADEELYSAHSLWSNEPVDKVSSDYIRTLTSDGWEYLDGDATLRRVFARIEPPNQTSGTILRFGRDDQYLTVSLRRDTGSRRTLISLGSTN